MKAPLPILAALILGAVVSAFAAFVLTGEAKVATVSVIEDGVVSSALLLLTFASIIGLTRMRRWRALAQMVAAAIAAFEI